jgi:cytoskeletal protein RodZ
MRILKRPTSQNSQPSTPPPTSSSVSIQDREAQYKAARERIFGPTVEDGSKELDPKELSAKVNPGVTVARQPRGPDSQNAAGFPGERRKQMGEDQPPRNK